jgi:hypothetical protein
MKSIVILPLVLGLVFGARAQGDETVPAKETPEYRPIFVEIHAWRIKDGKLYRMDTDLELPREIVELAAAKKLPETRGRFRFSTRQDGVLWHNSVQVRSIDHDRADIRTETSISEGDFRVQGAHESVISSELDRVAANHSTSWPLVGGFQWFRYFSGFDRRMQMEEDLLRVYTWVRLEQDPMPELIKIFERKDSLFFSAALCAGWRSADAEAAVPFLVDALSADGSTRRRVRDRPGDNTGWRARAAAAEALGRIGPVAKEAVPRLTELLNDEFEGVRYQAAIALGEIRHPDPEAIAALEALAKSTNDVRLREFAEDSLCHLQRAARKEAKKSPAP